MVSPPVSPLLLQSIAGSIKQFTHSVIIIIKLKSTQGWSPSDSPYEKCGRLATVNFEMSVGGEE